MKLHGVSYHWKKDQYPDWGFRDARQIGLIAQNVEAVVPELVSTDSNGYKAVSYDKLTVVLVEAVKELKAENEELKAENDVFKAQLKAENEQLRRQQSQIDELRAIVKGISG